MIILIETNINIPDEELFFNMVIYTCIQIYLTVLKSLKRLFLDDLFNCIEFISIEKLVVCHISCIININIHLEE